MPNPTPIPTPNPNHDEPGDSRVWLIAIAAPRELDAAISAFGYIGEKPKIWDCVPMSARFDLVYTGVGKANAAGAVARTINPTRHRGVLSIGIGGAMPDSGLELGDVVCATSSGFADEGVRTPSGFESCAQIGFGAFGDETDSITHDPKVIDWLKLYCDHAGFIACVSSCSGSNADADEVVSRTGAAVEAMEGAAVCLAAHRIDPKLQSGELRVISNFTGDRADQRWDLDQAMSKLTQVLGRIARGH